MGRMGGSHTGIKKYININTVSHVKQKPKKEHIQCVSITDAR